MLSSWKKSASAERAQSAQSSHRSNIEEAEERQQDGDKEKDEGPSGWSELTLPAVPRPDPSLPFISSCR